MYPRTLLGIDAAIRLKFSPYCESRRINRSTETLQIRTRDSSLHRNGHRLLSSSDHWLFETMGLAFLPRTLDSLASFVAGGNALSVSAVGDGGSSSDTIAADLIFLVRLTRFIGRDSSSCSYKIELVSFALIARKNNLQSFPVRV